MTRKHEEIGTEEEVIVEEAEVEETDVDESGDEGEAEDVPLWMAEEDELESSEDEDEEDEEDDGKGGSVPVSTHVKKKKKLQAEIKELKRQLAERPEPQEQRQQDPQPQPVSLEMPKRPRVSDFGTDDEYEEAMDKYEEQKLAYQTQYVQQTSSQKQKIEQRQRAIKEAVEGHYERAAKLVKEHSISPDVFKQTDTKVREVVQDIFGEQRTEAVVSDLIDSVGEGSEKVLFSLGRNKSKLAEFESLLRKDQTGLKAVAFLNRMAGQYNGPKNQSSRAPKPPANASGESTTNAKESALKKKWNEAHKKGNADEARKFKKQAKVNGFDTSTWR